MTWTDERTEFVKAQWADGTSAADIAAALGVSRNSVLGKVHRMRLEGGPEKPASRGAGTRHASELAKARAALFPFVKRARRVRRTEAAKIIEIPRDISLPANESPHPVTFENLKEMHCRWVLGEPSEQLYCGEDRKPGSSYCHRHHAIAYTKPEGGERKKTWIDFRKRAA